MNPYEPPLTPPESVRDDLLVAWPASGAYRYHSSLVWHRESPLPKVCVRSGLPANGQLRLSLRALIDDDGSLRPSDAAHAGEYVVMLPINVATQPKTTHQRIGGGLLGIGIVLGLALFLVPGIAGALEFAPLLYVGVGLTATALVVAGLRLARGPAPIQLLCVDRGFLQLFGVHPTFLAALPEWPVPDEHSR
jgi:hypothetical protein